MTRLLDPVLPATYVPNTGKAAPVAKSKVPVTDTESPQNLEVRSTIAIGLVLDGNNHRSPTVMIQ